MPQDRVDHLSSFLVEAKRRTYAGLDDGATIATPLLPGSKQLEHRAGNYLYRDIYFGMSFFVGQETVAKGNQVIWSMSYSGGVRNVTDRTTVPAIYAFLRKALLRGSLDKPYRGPETFDDGAFRYTNNCEGDFARFHGLEHIHHEGTPVYALHYSGGLTR